MTKAKYDPQTKAQPKNDVYLLEDLIKMILAVIGASAKSGEQGGAENFFSGLVSALRKLGVYTEFVCLISDETNFKTILDAYLQFYDLDLSKYDGVISTKAPSYLIRHPNHICYLVHTMRVFYDMFDTEFQYATKDLKEQRRFIQMLDTTALKYPRTKKVFVIGNEVRNRLLTYNNIDSTVLHPGLIADHFREGPFTHVFMPGRLHRWKRVDLVIKAMKYVKSNVKLKIAGVGEDEEVFKELAAHDERIEFLGRVPDETMIDLFANALCVPFVPAHEDYGYITIESQRSGKPVITCSDSGEPRHFIQDGETGFICEPDPVSIAEKIDYLYEHPDIAQIMGARGKLTTQHIRWEIVAEELLSSLMD